jgi:hypothetical protein
VNEPNDITHTDDNGVKYSYLGGNSYAVWMDKESRPYWREMPCNDIESAGYIRLVADIERIAELEESNKTLMQRATDLERELWLINQSKAGEQ